MEARGDLDEHSYYWWKWRVPFRYVYIFFNDLKFCEPKIVDMFVRRDFIDSEGILDVDTPRKIMGRVIDDPRVG